MPIRDVVLTLFLFGSLPFCFFSPRYGVLIWTWLAFMNPHRLTWGFANQIPFSMLIGLATLAGLPGSTERRPLPKSAEVKLIIALWALFVVTTFFAVNQELAWPELDRVSKIYLMILVTLVLCQTRQMLRYLLLTTALSIGYYGLKGGIWGVVTGGGSGWVLGPDRSFIGDNNGLALALNMTLPMFFFFARDEQNRWLRRLLYAVFFFSIIAVILTYSRGGFLSLIIVLTLIFPGVKHKVLALGTAAGGAVLVLVMAPDRWFNRIASIAEYERDSSATARIQSWWLGWQLGLDNPVLGAGFLGFATAWKKYLNSEKWWNAHGIYPRILGEHGFTGLFLFLALLICTLVSIHTIRRRARKLPEAADQRYFETYAVMLRASFVAYVIEGFFSPQPYFDLSYLVIAAIVILKQLLHDTETAPRPAPEPAPTRTATVARPGFIPALGPPVR